MRSLVVRGVSLVLALAFVAGPLMTTAAEAGHRRFKHRRHVPHRVYRERHVYHDRHHHGAAIVPFLGGVALGTIIGSGRSYCSPRPRVRVYVYGCGFCDDSFRGYDAYVDHLIYVHHVARCDIDPYYPPYHGGYWDWED